MVKCDRHFNIQGSQTVSHEPKSIAFVILKEANNLMITIYYRIKIPRLTPRNDIVMQPVFPGQSCISPLALSFIIAERAFKKSI